MVSLYVSLRWKSMVSRVMRKAAWGPVRRSHLWRERVVFESSSSMESVNDGGVLKRSPKFYWCFGIPAEKLFSLSVCVKKLAKHIM